MKKLRELLRANRWFAVVLLLEAAVLASLAASLFGSPYKLQLTSADFSNDYPQIGAANLEQQRGFCPAGGKSNHLFFGRQRHTFRRV